MEVEEVVVAPEKIVEQVEEAEKEDDRGTAVLEFPKLSAKELSGGKIESRRITIPAHRYTPLKDSWMKIYRPIVQHLKLEIRMNIKKRCVEVRTGSGTTDPGAIQKAEDFIKAFVLGFDVDDAVALLRLEELYVESFQIEDVKTLKGAHKSRAIGRIAGKGGRTKFAIENSTKTRVVLADSHIHILGTFDNIRMARDAIVDLILGSPPGKVYAKLRNASARASERF